MRMNQSCVDRGKFTWPVVSVGPRCIRLRVLLGKLDYNGTDIVFNDIRNKSSTCIIVSDTQMRARTVQMELAGSSVHVKIYNKRVSTRATLINTLGHRERSFACRGCIVRVSGTILDIVYIPKLLSSSENFRSIYNRSQNSSYKKILKILISMKICLYNWKRIIQVFYMYRMQFCLGNFFKRE